MQRSIQFWRLVAADGTDLKGAFPSSSFVNLLANAESAGVDRYWECRNGMVLLAKAAGQAPYPMIVLDKVRQANFPSVGDAAGTRRPLPLAVGENLLEPTFVAFLPNNVVAVLMSGDGPRPQRLAEYLRRKCGAEISVVPVLRRDLNVVLDEMRITEVQVAIPSERIDRELVGGEWAEALHGASALSDGGIVRVGISVGRSGTRSAKRLMGQRLRVLVDQLRTAAGFGDFNVAKAIGVHHGNRQVIDLIEDQLVERVDVDADRIGNPDEAVDYARSLLAAQIASSLEFLVTTNPAPGDGVVALATQILPARTNG